MGFFCPNCKLSVVPVEKEVFHCGRLDRVPERFAQRAQLPIHVLGSGVVYGENDFEELKADQPAEANTKR